MALAMKPKWHLRMYSFGKSLCGVVLIGGIVVGHAWGHAVIVEASPSPQAKLASPPQRAMLRFNVKIEKAFARVTLKDSRNHVVSLAVPKDNFSPEADPTCLSLPLPPLAPGPYQLRYRILAIDGHITEGVLSFQIIDSEQALSN